MNNLIDIDNMLINIASLTVYKNFLTCGAGVKFLIFLEAVQNEDSFVTCAEFYSDFVSELYTGEFRGNFSSTIQDFIFCDENPVSIDCAKGHAEDIPTFIMGAFEFELRILSDIASITFADIRELLNLRYPDFKTAVNSLPSFESSKMLFTKDIVQSQYKKAGYGLVSKHFAFKLDDKSSLIPVKNADNIKLSDLKLYFYQKDILLKNTQAFVSGKACNNVLLYGDRGCGKSSSVKAVVNEFKDSGLKIVQLVKNQIGELPDLIEFLANFPSKFIIFIDDLVFNENDSDFAAAKAVLEGSLAKRPDNTVIYATTNRRHLVKETFSGREGDEVHINDTMDEAASLSDRFGITITFSSPDKKDYLEIVRMLAIEAGITPNEDLSKQAEAFALLKGTRAPRIARQFLTCKIGGNVI